MYEIQATQIIRTLDNGKQGVLPIIALTANAVKGAKEMFLSSGMDDFLSKPIELRSLASILQKWVPKEKQKPLTKESNTEEKPQTINEILVM